jgi:hypothetical protein
LRTDWITPQAIAGRLQQWEHDKDIFLARGFRKSIMERIAPFSIMPVWDSFQLFVHCCEIPYRGRYCEIGSAQGGSIVIADEARNYKENKFDIIAISPHGNELSNMALVENTKHINYYRIEDYSQNVHSKIDYDSLDLLLVDGSHRYPQVKSDIENYWPKIKQGGVYLGHDFDYRSSSKEPHTEVVQAHLEYFAKMEMVKLKMSKIVRVIKE